LRPVRGCQALHAPALLIHQDGDIAPARTVSYIVREGAQLCRVNAVAAHEDDPGGARIAQKRALVGREHGARQGGYEGSVIIRGGA